MEAREVWKIIQRNRRIGNRLRRIRREFFEEPLREVRGLLARYVAERPRASDDFLVEHWRREIEGYLDGLRRSDESIDCCEVEISAAWRELRRN